MPRKFSFPLQTLLRVRGLAEREAQRKVAAALAELTRIETAQAELRTEVSERHAALNTQQQGQVVRPEELVRGRAWVVSLKQRIAANQVDAERRQVELRQRQMDLAEARKQTRVIEKLRERRWEAWKKSVSKAEQTKSDEAARQLLQLRVED